MGDSPNNALFQSFLPVQGHELTRVWKFSWEFGGRRPLHFHAEPELNLVVAGTATFRIGDTRIEAIRGDLLAFPPGQDHELIATSPDVYLFAIGMDPVYSDEVLRANRDYAAMPMHVRLPSCEFQSLVARSGAIVDRDGMAPLAAELWEQAHWLRRHHGSLSNNRIHICVRRALSVVAEHPDWDCERVAQVSRTRASELSRYFHRDLGMTFVKYRTRQRLLRLIRLMDTGPGTLMSMAIAAGFGSYSQCHRAFHAELGCFPRQFFQSGFREQMQSVYAR